MDAVSDLVFNQGVSMNGSVLIDFYADWCGPCKAISPLFDKLRDEHKGIQFVKVNVDEQMELASELGVQSIPTILFLKDGTEIDRIVGLIQERLFREKIAIAFGQ